MSHNWKKSEAMWVTAEHAVRVFAWVGIAFRRPPDDSFEPTVFDGVTPEMAIAREEIFGPVLSILTFKTKEEAIQIANDTLYGLSAGLWTSNVDTAFEVSRKIRAGTIWINCFMDGYPRTSLWWLRGQWAGA